MAYVDPGYPTLALFSLLTSSEKPVYCATHQVRNSWWGVWSVVVWSVVVWGHDKKGGGCGGVPLVGQGGRHLCREGGEQAGGCGRRRGWGPERGWRGHSLGTSQATKNQKGRLHTKNIFDHCLIDWLLNALMNIFAKNIFHVFIVCSRSWFKNVFFSIYGIGNLDAALLQTSYQHDKAASFKFMGWHCCDQVTINLMIKVKEKLLVNQI